MIDGLFEVNNSDDCWHRPQNGQRVRYLGYMSVLLLNASYEPLRVISWQRAICLQLAERADVIEAVEGRALRTSGGAEFAFPSVIRLREMVVVPFRRGAAPITRRALVARDRGECQKTGCDRRGATMDHLLPKSRGGQHTWLNVVLMCAEHNNAKSNRTMEELGWTLKNNPRAPSHADLALDRSEANPQWRQWLTRFGDLDERQAG